MNPAPVDPILLLRISAWLLGAAAATGSAIAMLRFAKDRPPPSLLARLHGALAAAGLALLTYGWAVVGVSKVASTALALLALAAAGGVVTAQARRWTTAPPIELLIFGHLAIAATGFLLLLAASLGGRA